MTSPPPGGRHAHLITVAADTSQMATLRAQVVEIAAADGATSELQADLSIVVTELATNVTRHAAADQITVSLRRDGDTWVLDVSGAPADVDLDAVERPAVTALSGRGLSIVRALMDVVEIVDVDGELHVRSTKRAT